MAQKGQVDEWVMQHKGQTRDQITKALPLRRPTAAELEQMNANRDAERSRHRMNWNDVDK